MKLYKYKRKAFIINFQDCGIVCQLAIDLDLPPGQVRTRVTEYLWLKIGTNYDSYNACSYHLLCLCSRCAGFTNSSKSWFYLPVFALVYDMAAHRSYE